MLLHWLGSYHSLMTVTLSFPRPSVQLACTIGRLVQNVISPDMPWRWYSRAVGYVISRQLSRDGSGVIDILYLWFWNVDVLPEPLLRNLETRSDRPQNQPDRQGLNKQRSR